MPTQLALAKPLMAFFDGRSSRKPLPRVLLAEDDRVQRRRIASVLADDGHEVVEAVDAFELVELVKHTRSIDSGTPEFDVIVSDYRMPVVTGLDALAYLRVRDLRTPFILMTALDDPPVDTVARRLGAILVVEKPVQVDHLRIAIRRLLPARRYS